MSQVFTCGCGRKTTQPFSVSGKLVCVVCAEDELPSAVDSREKFNKRRDRYENGKVPTGRYGVS